MLIKSKFLFPHIQRKFILIYDKPYYCCLYIWSTACLIDLFTKYVLYPCMFIIYVLYLCKHSLHKIQQYYCLIDEQRVCMGPICIWMRREDVISYHENTMYLVLGWSRLLTQCTITCYHMLSVISRRFFRLIGLRE